MKTVDKAMGVLDQFSAEKTEIGLSELARMAGLDKAATRRLLVALSKHGFIEQSQETRKYRLGHGFLRLARIREATVPVRKAAQDVADWLVETANETVHICVPGPQGMTTIAHRLPNRGHVIRIVPAQLLYYHASAAGLAYLAGSTDETVGRLLSLKREKITENTLTSKADLWAAIRRYRAQGHARTSDTFVPFVAGLALPFRGDGPDPAGSIALALPAVEMTDDRCDALLPVLGEAIKRMEGAVAGL